MKKYFEYVWALVIAVITFLLSWLLVSWLSNVAIHIAWYLVPAVLFGVLAFIILRKTKKSEVNN